MKNVNNKAYTGTKYTEYGRIMFVPEENDCCVTSIWLTATFSLQKDVSQQVTHSWMKEWWS